MISKYGGICRYCKLPTKAGQDQYDLDTKTGYHDLCKEADETTIDPSAYILAERLGYIHYDPAGEAAGLLRRMLPRDRGGSAGRNEPAPFSRPKSDLPPGFTSGASGADD